MKSRNPWIAGLLSALCTGLGFLYVGRPGWALALLLLYPLLFAVAGWSGAIFFLWGFAAVILAAIALWVAVIAVAAAVARRQAPAPLRRYQRWYVYVLYFALANVFLGAVIERRGPLFNYEMYRFPSSSMTETLLPGDYIVSNPRKFRGADPSRGDLVVLLYPPDPTIKYVKRVVGLPGETIRIRGGEVFANGVRLQEPYVSTGNNQGQPGIPGGEFKVPDGQFFVLGDNRDNSSDSRIWGSVPRANLYGNVEYIWFSMHPVYGVRSERIGARPK